MVKWSGQFSRPWSRDEPAATVESHIVPRPFSYASHLALAALLAASGAAIATVEPLPGASPQTGRLGASYPVALAVMVRDANGRPIAGTEVRFLHQSGAICCLIPSNFEGYRVRTDARGIATLPHAFALSPGVYRIDVESAFGATQLHLETADSPPPGSVLVIGGNGQALRPGSPFAEALRVRVFDTDGAALAYAVVWIETTPAHGAPIIAIADAEGIVVAPPFVPSATLGPGQVRFTAWSRQPGKVSATIDYRIEPF